MHVILVSANKTWKTETCDSHVGKETEKHLFYTQAILCVIWFEI